uniref:Uaz158(Alt) n=1 Tax=Arundo donax TaxID=35708 RepID=A0A0A9FSL8_ARUDO
MRSNDANFIHLLEIFQLSSLLPPTFLLYSV